MENNDALNQEVKLAEEEEPSFLYNGYDYCRTFFAKDISYFDLEREKTIFLILMEGSNKNSSVLKLSIEEDSLDKLEAQFAKHLLRFSRNCLVNPASITSSYYYGDKNERIAVVIGPFNKEIKLSFERSKEYKDIILKLVNIEKKKPGNK